VSQELTVECEVHFDRQARGRKRLTEGATAPRREPGRVPRVARLMALALRFEGLLRDGVVKDYAELARLGHVTRARVTQVMNLLHLAPERWCAINSGPCSRACSAAPPATRP